MAAVALFATAWIAAPGNGLAKPIERRTIDLEIRKRKVTAVKNKTIRLTEGETVQLNWTTDKAVELHLHGYDVEVTVEPGRAAPMTFRAHTAGRFPVSAHGFGHRTILYLEVLPR